MKRRHTCTYVWYSIQYSIHNSTKSVPEGAQNSTHEVIGWMESLSANDHGVDIAEEEVTCGAEYQAHGYVPYVNLWQPSSQTELVFIPSSSEK